jgi:hypothetical protein
MVKDDIVKLRLRGKGLGAKKNDKKSLLEPLNLTISSKYYDKYCIAVG